MDAGPIEDFPCGAVHMVRAGRHEIGVVMGANGEIYAIANRCPHRGGAICKGALGGTLMPSEPGELVFGMAGEVLRCPWHGYEFSLRTGKCLFTGLALRLRTYRVEVRDGRVHIDMKERGDRS